MASIMVHSPNQQYSSIALTTTPLQDMQCCSAFFNVLQTQETSLTSLF